MNCPICNQPIRGAGYQDWFNRSRKRICDECHERKVRQETAKPEQELPEWWGTTSSQRPR